MLPEQTHQLIPGFLLKTEQSHALRRAKAHGLPSPGSPCHRSRADTGAADPTRPSARAHRTPSTEAVPLQGLRTQALQPSSWCWQALSKNLRSFPSRHLSEFAVSHVTRTSFILCTSLPLSLPALCPLKRILACPLGTVLSLPSQSQRGELGVKLQQEAQSAMLAEPAEGQWARPWRSRSR